jgi:predicted HicB family RNase H-like nuclease
MARKKPEKKDVPVSQAILKLVRLEIPPEYHRDLRILAAKQETTMAILVRKVVQEYIDQQRKGGKL